MKIKVHDQSNVTDHGDSVTHLPSNLFYNNNKKEQK